MTDVLTASELRFERLLPAPVETVWQYLVDSELRARWFMGGETELKPGGRMEFVFDHDNLSDGDVPVPEKYAVNYGARWSEEVVRVEPPHVLAFTFDSAESIATFELEAVGADQTRLVLTHSNIASRRNAINFAGGWSSHLAVLERRLAGQGVPDFWALHAECEAKAAEALAE